MTIVPEAVVTFSRLDGYAIVASLGAVRGEAVAPRNFLRSTFRSIGALVGLSALEIASDAERARRESLAALVRAAQALGANAVVSARFETRELRDGSTRVLAAGEAVVLDPAPGRTS